MSVDLNHIFSTCSTSIFELILYHNALGIWGFYLFWGFLRFCFFKGVLQRITCFFDLKHNQVFGLKQNAQITAFYQHIISVSSYWKGCQGSVCNAIPTRISTLFKPQLHKKISPYNTWGCLTGVTPCWKAVLSLSVNLNCLKCATNLYSNGTEWGISLRVTFTTQLHWHQSIQIVPECTPT